MKPWKFGTTCDFCGEMPAVYVDGFWICMSGDCDDELTQAVLECRDRERAEFEESQP